MRNSAGTMASRPPRVSHQGAVLQRDRKWKRGPPVVVERMKDEDP
jgi:hypothetical protein